MSLQLKRPLVFIDLETTGTNLSTDRIVEIAIVKVFPDGIKNGKTKNIKSPDADFQKQQRYSWYY